MLQIWLSALPWMLGLGLLGWLVSLRIKNVAIVDSLWALFFLVGLVVYLAAGENTGERVWLISTLVVLWSTRLSLYMARRNLGHPEDRRYQEIRRNNDPGFAFKSLYLVFGLQAVLAWIVSTVILAGLHSQSASTLSLLDYLAVTLWGFGFIFESVADRQLATFQARPENHGKVLQTGLWRYSRHPNYFGEFCIWWAFYLFAVAAGQSWAVIGPLIMSLLLLRISGVALMEKGMAQRRPDYAGYIRRTSSFFPLPPKFP